MSSLKLTNVNMVYPSGETALYNVNLQAEDREFLVVFGDDKSGKSSLLRAIAGLEDVTDGTISIDDKDVTSVEAKDRDIAMVFKSGTLNASLSVEDNLAFGLRLRKAPEALVKERVKIVSEILGLSDVLTRKPKVLTAAAKQRAIVGRAVVREPKIYLFDEPFSGLDEKLKQDMLSVVINLQARLSGTFVYATKSLSEAMSIGTRIAVLKNGFVQQIDLPENLYDYPSNEFVAFTIGSPTVNFIRKVKITLENGVYYGVNGSFKLEIPQNIVARFENISEYVDSDKYVTLGLRPEDLKISKEGEISAKASKADEGKKFAECEVTPDICLNVTTNGEVSRSAEVSIAADLSKLLIFDGQTALTLLKRDGGYKLNSYADSQFMPMPKADEQSIHESLNPKKQVKKK